MPERRYDDEEVGLILREASRAQEGRRQGGGEGLSLAQLKQIATEVGLDPGAVETAARRLAQNQSARRSLFFGTPVAPEFEDEIAGELGPEELAEIVTAIRKATGRRGVSEAELGALEWSARDAMGGRYVSVLAKGGATRLRVFGNFRDGLMLVALGVGIPLTVFCGSILGALGLRDLVGGPGVVLLGMLLSVLPVRALWRWWYRREELALAELTTALGETTRELVATRLSSPESDSGDPRGPGTPG